MMTNLFFKCRPFRLGAIVCAGLLANLLTYSHVVAANISFDLSLTGTALTITHKGDGTAFYPKVLRMAPDGQWEPLANANQKPSAEFLPGTNLNVVWPEQAALETLPPAARLQPVMIRFFDQAGVGFGQISFFTQPPYSDITLQTSFSGKKLAIHPPDPQGKPVRVSWLLWPKEDGIDPIKRQVRYEHVQPPATRIVWAADTKTQYIEVGAGQPATVLLHETDDGVSIQRLSSGGLQGREQRAAWLDSTNLLYRLSMALLLAAAISMAVSFAWPRIEAKRKGAKI